MASTSSFIDYLLDPTKDPSYSQFQRLREEVETLKGYAGKSYRNVSEHAKAVSKPRPRCIGCSNELCDELDAYYGKNPSGKKYCSKCRRQNRID